MQCAELFIFGSYFSKCNRTKVSQVTKWMKIIHITVCVLSLANLTRNNFSITSERALMLKSERTQHTHCPLEHRMQPLSAVCYKRMSRMAWNQLHHCMKQCFFQFHNNLVLTSQYEEVSRTNTSLFRICVCVPCPSSRAASHPRLWLFSKHGHLLKLA